MDEGMEDDDTLPGQADEADFGKDLYKKWFKSGGQSGFLSLRPWLETGKISVDIGELKDNQLVGHTQVWTNIMDLGLYLKSVYDGTGAKLFPASDKLGLPTIEGFVYYGGSTIEGKDISRVLKIHHWSSGENSYDSRAFAWKSGHFEGRKGPTGAFIPNMQKCLSMNMIKISRQEMAQAHMRVELALQGYAARNEDWFNWSKKTK